MLKPELYKKTVDILYDAYFKGTLMHGDCAYCAVGNICAGNGVPRCKWETDENNFFNNSSWSWVFMTPTGYHLQDRDDRFLNRDSTFYKPNIDRVINATGYTWQELARIEHAFEKAPSGNNDEDWMFNGLVAVLEVLKQIHEVTDEDADMNTTRFRTHYKNKLVKDGYRF